MWGNPAGCCDPGGGLNELFIDMCCAAIMSAETPWKPGDEKLKLFISFKQRRLYVFHLP